MAASGDPDRVAVVDGDIRLTTAGLSALADGGAGVITASGASHVVYVGTGGALLPLLLFSSARANTAFTPLNYRLSPDGLRQLIDRLPDPLIVVDVEYRDVVTGPGDRVMTSDEFIEAARSTEPVSAFADPDDVAVVLFTSGTTSRPKAVELTHNNLTSYVTGTVEFGSADPADAALVCVPPYHIAGVGAALSNLYAGRAIVYLRRFDPQEWVRLVRDERVTTATVVPASSTPMV
jgi:acyl-CoA synthetase (AMP-forming)/AMP-acid ligase II